MMSPPPTGDVTAGNASTDDDASTNLNSYDYYWSRNESETGPDDWSDWCWSDIAQTLWENGKWEIPLYSAIFLLSVVGNILVILTLGKENRMRTVTNVFLLNLAASDLVLAVLCMPFTLIGTLLRDFIFGNWMCKFVPFLQATSVAASVWTLVSLSIERYYAICHPLRSRKWQTTSHAHKLIAAIWVGGSLAMLPILVLSELQPTRKGHNKCRENWPEGDYERIYNLLLDLLLLVVPLLTLAATYYLIAVTLWKDLKRNHSGNAKSLIRGRKSSSMDANSASPDSRGYLPPHRSIRFHDRDVIFTTCSSSDLPEDSDFIYHGGEGGASPSPSCFRKARIRSETDVGMRKVRKTSSVESGHICLRHTNYERSLIYKQRVIKMLFVVVLEFFICWTPLYVINTLALFWPHVVYGTVGYKTISFCQLLAYTSGCCNPITYCFMNKAFRKSFINMVACRKRK